MIVANIPTAIVNEIEILLPEQQTRKCRRLAEYTLGLMVKDGKKSINAINGLYMDTCDQSNLNRAVNSMLWNPNTLNIRRIKRYTVNKRGGIVIIDDTLQEKWGKHMEGFGSLYDTSSKRYIMGHNFVTSLYVNGNEEVPLFAQLYLKEDDAKLLGRSFHSKIEIACWVLKASCTVLKPSFMVVDSWYFADELIKTADSLGIIWVADAKSNRIVYEEGKEFSLLEYSRQIPITEYREFPRKTESDEDKLYRYATCRILQMKGIGLVKVLFLRSSLTDLEEGKVKFTVTKDVTLPIEKIIEIRDTRWKIEEMHRACKQSLGFGEYHVRNMNGTTRHLSLVFLAYTLLKVLLARPIKGLLLGIANTIGEACQRIRELVLEGFARWVIKTYNREKSVDRVMSELKGIFTD